jgi:hypothetical protein
MGGILLTVGLYQNCAPGFRTLEFENENILLESTSNPNARTCLFNGLSIVSGGTVTAYKLPNVPSGQTCVSETRSCTEDGVLTGSYTQPSCLVTAPGNCALGGQEIVNGATATGYSAQQVEAGQTCSSVSATATCNNGVLSANIYPTCMVADAMSCKFNGQFVPDGSTITAYLASAVPYGGACSPETRTCHGGDLSGSFTAASCTPAPASSCNFNGSKVADGGTVQAFAANMVPYGQSCSSVQKPMLCKNGVFVYNDGTAVKISYPSCITSPTTTCNYGDKTLQSGETVQGYLQSIVPAGKTCDLMSATCDGGILTGLSPFTSVPLSATCSVGACRAGDTIIQNQQTVTGYTTTLVGHSQSCSSVQKTWTCKDRTLVDEGGNPANSFYSTCQPAATTTCSIRNWASGMPAIQLASGETVTGYSSETVREGTTCAAIEEKVSCNDGIASLNGVSNAQQLSGLFYLYKSCNVGACKGGSQIILDGATISGYTSSFVAYGQSCSSISTSATCKDTMLEPANGPNTGFSTTCTPAATADCRAYDLSNSFALVKIENGKTLTGYSQSTASSGKTCDDSKLTLACSNGLISRNGGAPFPSSSTFYSVCK